MGKTKQNAERKEEELEGSHVALLEPEGTLPGKPQPSGDTQITRNDLNSDIRVIQQEARATGPRSNFNNIVSVSLFRD